MSRVEELEQQIRKLSPEELSQLSDWILELDWSAWDRQIERDSASGKLNELFKKSLKDHAAGKSREE
jgi:hypothetical protein